MLFFKKKEKQILLPEDIMELKELERKAYMEKARELVVKKGKQSAEINIPIKKEDPYA